jgi:DNA-binding response OmpR family regulator
MNNSEHSYHIEYTGCVLVIDDDRRVRQMLSLALGSVGFDVLGASTQQQIRRRLAGIRPDAVVLNFQRSQADGLDVLYRMRARQDLAQVPILFLAGSDTDDFRWQAVRAGADWFGLRPVAIVELRSRLSRLIRTGRPRLKLIAARDCPSGSRCLKPTG